MMFTPDDSASNLLQLFSFFRQTNFSQSPFDSSYDVETFLKNDITNPHLHQELNNNPSFLRCAVILAQSFYFQNKVFNILSDKDKFSHYLETLCFHNDDASHDQVTENINRFLTSELSPSQALRIRILMAEEKVSYQLGFTESDFIEAMELFNDEDIYLEFLNLLCSMQSNNWDTANMLDAARDLLYSHGYQEDDWIELEEFLISSLNTKPAPADEDAILWEEIKSLIKNEELFLRFRNEVDMHNDTEDIMQTIDVMFSNMGISEELKNVCKRLE